jgi:hypothetical protein
MGSRGYRCAQPPATFWQASGLLLFVATEALVVRAVLIMLMTRNIQVASWTPPELWGGVGGNVVTVMLLAGSAVLFRKAARGEPEPGAV